MILQRFVYISDQELSDSNLSVFAFGRLPNRKITELEQLASRGKGNFANVTKANIDAALLQEAKAVRE